MARRCGFVATYNAGCRCRPCTDAKARAQARYRAKNGRGNADRWRAEHPGRNYLSNLNGRRRRDNTQD